MKAGTTTRLRRIGVTLLLITLTASAGCTGTPTDPAPEVDTTAQTGSTEFQLGQGHTVERFIDREAGVVCYVARRSDPGGIDCLPIEQTQLAR